MFLSILIPAISCLCLLQWWCAVHLPTSEAGQTLRTSLCPHRVRTLPRTFLPRQSLPALVWQVLREERRGKFGKDNIGEALANAIHTFFPTYFCSFTEWQFSVLCCCWLCRMDSSAVHQHSQFPCQYVPNEYSLQLAREFPEMFISVGSVNPYRHDALKELQHLAVHGVTIIKWLVGDMNPAHATPCLWGTHAHSVSL